MTEWAKRDQCWERASALTIQLSDDVRTELVSKTEQRQAGRAARSQQRVDDGIGDQAAVIELGQAYWARSPALGQPSGVTCP